LQKYPVLFRYCISQKFDLCYACRLIIGVDKQVLRSWDWKTAQITDNLLSEKIKIAFTFVPGTWEENLTKFRNGEVDAITEISHTPEREAFTRFTTPYYLIPIVVYTRENSFSYNGVETLKGRVVGMETGIYYKDYMQAYPDIRYLINAHTKQHGGFRLSFHKNWYPLDFMDDQNAHTGIAAQRFDMAAQTHGIRLMEQVSGSLEEAVDAAFKKESDMLPAIVPSSRFNTKLIFTRPYLSLPLVIATRSDEFFVGNLRGLSENRIGMVDRWISISLEEKVDYTLVWQLSITDSLTGLYNRHKLDVHQAIQVIRFFWY
jgi:hypothetical protein